MTMEDLFSRIVSCDSKSDLRVIQSELKNAEEELALSHQPSYRQKVDTDRIKILNSLLQSKANQLSKKKFSFEGPPIPANAKSQVSLAQPVFAVKDSIQDIRDTVYEINANGHVVVDSVQHSLVRTASVLPSLHLKNGEDSVFCVSAKGPIFVHNVERCILILECHQARLHNVHNSIVLVQSVENDRIIIENCSQLRVNNGIEVDDFDFPTKETENPHFQRIDTARDAEILNGINAGGDVATVDLLLRTCIGAP